MQWLGVSAAVLVCALLLALGSLRLAARLAGMGRCAGRLAGCGGDQRLPATDVRDTPLRRLHR